MQIELRRENLLHSSFTDRMMKLNAISSAIEVKGNSVASEETYFFKNPQEGVTRKHGERENQGPTRKTMPILASKRSISDAAKRAPNERTVPRARCAETRDR